jgi:hypothetical protein
MISVKPNLIMIQEILYQKQESKIIVSNSFLYYTIVKIRR